MLDANDIHILARSRDIDFTQQMRIPLPTVKGTHLLAAHSDALKALGFFVFLAMTQAFEPVLSLNAVI